MLLLLNSSRVYLGANLLETAASFITTNLLQTPRHRCFANLRTKTVDKLYNSGMYAKRFESLLATEAGKTDLSQRTPDDMAQRFESLRGYRLLPAGRTKNVTPLSLPQMAAAILAIATVKPEFAGLAGKTLSNLRPVGTLHFKIPLRSAAPLNVFFKTLPRLIRFLNCVYLTVKSTPMHMVVLLSPIVPAMMS